MGVIPLPYDLQGECQKGFCHVFIEWRGIWNFLQGKRYSNQIKRSTINPGNKRDIIFLLVWRGCPPLHPEFLFGLTQKGTKKFRASPSPFPPEADKFRWRRKFFSFAVLPPGRRSPYLQPTAFGPELPPGVPHTTSLQEPARLKGHCFFTN